MAAIVAEADTYHVQARAASTLRAYRADWQIFEAWCGAHELAALPATPETVALYITEMARDRKVSTITRHLASIAQAHKQSSRDTSRRLVLRSCRTC
jgi:site-specific recombinase XerD